MLSKNEVDGHVAVLVTSLDKDSPFKGLVDLSDLGKMPHEHQMQIWNALEPAYQLLYEEMVKQKKREANEAVHSNK
jgi:hypothetical protein